MPGCAQCCQVLLCCVTTESPTRCAVPAGILVQPGGLHLPWCPAERRADTAAADCQLSDVPGAGDTAHSSHLLCVSGAAAEQRAGPAAAAGAYLQGLGCSTCQAARLLQVGAGGPAESAVGWNMSVAMSVLLSALLQLQAMRMSKPHTHCMLARAASMLFLSDTGVFTSLCCLSHLTILGTLPISRDAQARKYACCEAEQALWGCCWCGEATCRGVDDASGGISEGHWSGLCIIWLHLHLMGPWWLLPDLVVTLSRTMSSHTMSCRKYPRRCGATLLMCLGPEWRPCASWG